MSTTISTAAFKAVEILQSRAGQAAPGSEWEHIAEAAIGYAIERVGVEDEVQFLVYDCHRNARSAYLRSRQRGRDAIRTHACRTYGRTILNDGQLDIVDANSVEEMAIATNSAFCERAQVLAGQLGAQGAAFVRRLMDGDTIAEAARAVGISRATANRWRALLAALLAPHRYLTEVAA